MRLILTRHAITEENAAKILLGQLPGTLSPEGILQAKQKRLQIDAMPLDMAYSSDLRRCLDTAEILVGHRGIVIHKDPRLREINFGTFQGKPHDSIRGDYLSDLSKSFPRGESNNQMIKRLIDCINDIYAKHAEDTVLIVSHSGPISVLLASTDRLTFRKAINMQIGFDELIIREINSKLDYPT